MKKWILLVLVLLVALVPAALAEEFSVRDIRFGMSLSQVQAAEGDEGRLLLQNTKVTYLVDELEGVKIGRASSDVLYYKFRFGSLYEIQFWSGYYETEAEAQAAFDTWLARIEERYGDCIDEAEPEADTECLAFYRENTSDFDGRCVRLKKLGLTVGGQKIVADLFLLPSVDDFQTFCVFDCLEG